jgi:predicted acyltransferase
MRGITIAGMLLVNNPGSWGHIYAPLEHAEWNGLTPTDLVFPFFMFIMGISTYLSLSHYAFRLTRATVIKIVRRTIVIFAIGLGVAWIGMLLRGLRDGLSLAEAALTFDHIRILGVLPRLAISYGVAAIVAVTVSHRFIPWLIATLLVAYAAILLTGHGYEFSDKNIISIVDHSLLGESHMYSDTVFGETLKFDPEGLLSTIPAIAHVLLGFCVGRLLMNQSDNIKRALLLLIVGVILTFAGLLLSYGLPINKKIWSPTFVLTTCGLASSLLGLLVWIVDIHRHIRWSRCFIVFGINPLALYTIGALLSILFSVIMVPYADNTISLHGYLYRAVMTPLSGGNATMASLLYAIAFVGINQGIGYILYKKQIYIKI